VLLTPHFTYLSVELANGDNIYLKSFNSGQIENFVDFIKSNDLVGTTIHATGGGAHKYADIFEREFVQKGVQVHKHDEMASMVNGLAFVLKYANKSSFSVTRGSSSSNEANQDSAAAAQQESQSYRNYEA